MSTAARSPNALLVPYALPYLAYVAVGALVDPRSHAELAYALRLVVAGGSLAWFWREYLPLTGAKSLRGSLAVGALAGLVGAGLWLALRVPFAEVVAGPAWSTSAWLARLVGATVLPPFIEELFFRVWVFRTVLLF